MSVGSCLSLANSPKYISEGKLLRKGRLDWWVYTISSLVIQMPGRSYLPSLWPRASINGSKAQGVRKLLQISCSEDQAEPECLAIISTCLTKLSVIVRANTHRTADEKSGLQV